MMTAVRAADASTQTYLLDVNVLIALFDQSHVHHALAHGWLERVLSSGARWATCPITENAFVRVLSHPKYLTAATTPADLVRRLRTFCSLPSHTFWADSVSLVDGSVFDEDLLGGHAHFTDTYLAALAAHHDAKLATFDQRINALPVRKRCDCVEVIAL